MVDVDGRVNVDHQNIIVKVTCLTKIVCVVNYARANDGTLIVMCTKHRLLMIIITGNG